MVVKDLLAVTNSEVFVAINGEIDGKTIQFMIIKNDVLFNLADFKWLHEKEVLCVEPDTDSKFGEFESCLAITVRLD